MRVIVTGATGFVGVRLVEQLHLLGNQVVVLARNPEKATRQFPKEFFPNVEIVGYTPLKLGTWTSAISGCDAVVNLAGTPIVEKRWSEKRKQEIIESRAATTKVLVEAIQAAAVKPKVLVSGSAIGYYGDDETQSFDEYSFEGQGFLAEVCQAWEAAANPVTNFGVRLVKLRIGIVLAYGGTLGKILPLFQLGIGGKIGSGKQWFSWIHRDDLVSLILFAIANSQIVGVLNATAPNPVTNEELTKTLAKVVGRPALLPVPAAALLILLGESATLILGGQKVLPQKATLNRFSFAYPALESALRQILG
ncbi:TIGR01777 family oxidoreductase [Tumidithrix elongata RA019]|uniref:TIGR01777 family oxidoreductase n=1 Tax=Tumidithrix elongata BACA0141 TaxID=2716417 RepID=A0AAW9Q753_9CYAN|nr:TIGR01777 family oxidoreductase [Tumidithrix elongata RA019]